MSSSLNLMILALQGRMIEERIMVLKTLKLGITSFSGIVNLMTRIQFALGRQENPDNLQRIEAIINMEAMETITQIDQRIELLMVMGNRNQERIDRITG